LQQLLPFTVLKHNCSCYY